MDASVIRRLKMGARLDESDERCVLASFAEPSWVEPREALNERRAADQTLFIHEGLAQVFRTLKGGGRQTTALLVPGDFITVRPREFEALHLDAEALARSRVSVLPLSAVRDWRRASAALDQAVEHVERVEHAVAREWLVSLGARSTLVRTAHLFCELRWRYRAIVPGDDDTLDLALNQDQLGQVIGASAVHVNRVLAHLRTEGLATARGGQISIHDRDRLQMLAGFDDAYLRLGARGSAT